MGRMNKYVPRRNFSVFDIGFSLKTKARMALGRKPRFTGAFPTRDMALNSLPVAARGAYDQDGLVEVNYTAMRRVAPWDYPVLYWLLKCSADHATLSVLDAGGHLGTKFSAFADHLPMDRINWSIWDLPTFIRTAKAWQAEGKIPGQITFLDDLSDSQPVEVLLASGLMQYVDLSLSEIVGKLPNRPRTILLNKVAVRAGETVVTLEQIGAAKVPYQIRNEGSWMAELGALGYEVVDDWDVPELRHRIDTHPWLGESQSKGYVLQSR